MSLRHFPKLERLITCKDEAVAAGHTHSGLSRSVDLSTTPLSMCLGGVRFTVILIDPPWYEYFGQSGGEGFYWNFEQIISLDISAISAEQSFCFIWAGNRHVEQATACLSHWGFRRIETICWIKSKDTNKTYGARNFFLTNKEYLLVGIKGSVSRSVDHHLIHANIDHDVVFSEGKPDEVYKIIERFCNSKSRLELFATRTRPGWVSLGTGFDDTFDARMYIDNHLGFTPTTAEIEQLRPKSPLFRSNTVKQP